MNESRWPIQLGSKQRKHRNHPLFMFVNPTVVGSLPCIGHRGSAPSERSTRFSQRTSSKRQESGSRSKLALRIRNQLDTLHDCLCSDEGSK